MHFCVLVAAAGRQATDREFLSLESRRDPMSLVQTRTRPISTSFRGYTFKAGSYIYVNSPTISRSEWHPFSIIQVPSTTPKAAFYAEAVSGPHSQFLRLLRCLQTGGDPPEHRVSYHANQRRDAYASGSHDAAPPLASAHLHFSNCSPNTPSNRSGRRIG